MLIMDYDAINYYGYGLTAINLKLCMQVVDTYSYRLMAFAISSKRNDLSKINNSGTITLPFSSKYGLMQLIIVGVV